MKLTSADIKIGLRSAFPAPGWGLFYEVGDSTGLSQRRWADAIALGLWPSNGHQIHGMEIKVSRGDFLAEMKDPTKSQAIYQFCHRWSLVTPPGLVKVDELPETWGLMTFDGKSVRTVKKAPTLTPVPPTPGFMAALVRKAEGVDDLIAAAVERTRRVCADERDRYVKSAVESDRRNRAHRLQELEQRLEQYTAIFGNMNSYQIARLGPAVKMIAEIGAPEAHSRTRNLLNSIEQARKQVSDALDEYERTQPFEDLLG